MMGITMAAAARRASRGDTLLGTRVQPGHSPPLESIAPFFLLAPLGLVLAGLLILGTGGESFVAINANRTVAITHALVVGWVTTFMMGACYQLGRAVLGGGLVSERILVRVHLALHAVAVLLFVWALATQTAAWAAVAGSILFLSFLLFLVNILRALATAPRWSIPRAYLLASTLFLLVAAAVGLTYALNREFGWFATTHGRLAAHAHLGLAGWLALTIMGVSYQLVPMFNVVNTVKPRFAWLALAVTIGSLILFALVMFTDPARDVRILLAMLLAAGPLLWALDQARLLRGRARRKMDIHGRGTAVGLGFLLLTVALGLGAAWGTPFTTAAEPARWPLAYAIAGIGGWAGSTIIANSFKIVPFLIWYHRYRPQMGKAPVPLVHDIYSEGAASLLLAFHAAATVVLIGAALAGSSGWLHAGGLLMVASGLFHLGAMLWMFLPKQSSRAQQPVLRGAPM